MQDNLGFMLRKEFFRVSGLAVCDIYITGFSVIDDVRFQDGNLRKTFFGGLDTRRKIVVTRCGGSRFFTISWLWAFSSVG